MRNASLYANETLTSFFRRLTFTPDGGLLLTPAGQYQTQHQADANSKPSFEVINTVYIYTRGGINKPPVAHLPGHKKPSVVIRCSPVFYTMRQSPPQTKHFTIDTSSGEEPIPALPEPLSKSSPAPSVMEPPPPPPATTLESPSSKQLSVDTPTSTSVGPKPAFSLPYRMIYAVATQDSVLLYDTQQQTPICIVSNLHCATFTDLTWYVTSTRPESNTANAFRRSSDGLTLLISSSDGFCSTLSFSPGELGQVYSGEVPSLKHPVVPGTASSSNQNTPVPTPTSVFAPPSPFHGSQHRHRDSASSFTAPSPPPTASFVNVRPSSPTRSNSTSSIATVSSVAPTGVITNPQLIVGSVPGIAAATSGKVTGIPITTPPETPRSATDVRPPGKRPGEASESEKEDVKEPKKRRIAPTPVAPEETKP
jgi:chromatin assembly factor 1 subunit B